MSKKERAKESARLIIKIIVQGMLNENQEVTNGII